MINLNELWTDTPNEERIQLIRNFKLAELRILRAVLLEESDLMAKDVSLGIRADKEAVKEYTLSLRNITVGFKSESDTLIATENIDDLDINNINWPVKPVWISQ
jgi:hypothetical protein